VVHTCNVTACRKAVSLQVTNTIRSYELNFHPVPHDVVTCERYITVFPVCYGRPSDVFAVSSGFVHLYTLRFKGKEKSAGGGKGNCTQQGSVQRFEFAGRLNFQSVSGLYKNLTRMSHSEFEFLINLIGEKISKNDTAFRKAISVQESLALTHSSTGLFISFPSSSRASCFLILLKCIVCFGSQIISFLS